MKILIIRKVGEKHVILKRNLWYVKYHPIYRFLFYSQYSGKVKVIRNCKIVIFSESYVILPTVKTVDHVAP